MADENRRENSEGEKDASSQTTGGESAGDPGRTPGAAEGDKETVEVDVNDKEQQGQL